MLGTRRTWVGTVATASSVGVSAAPATVALESAAAEVEGWVALAIRPLRKKVAPVEIPVSTRLVFAATSVVIVMPVSSAATAARPVTVVVIVVVVAIPVVVIVVVVIVRVCWARTRRVRS